MLDRAIHLDASLVDIRGSVIVELQSTLALFCLQNREVASVNGWKIPTVKWFSSYSSCKCKPKWMGC
jgi:hypothetical protein